MNMVSIVFLMFLVYTNSVRVTPQTLSRPNNIFILAGQSNMAGSGGMSNSGWDGVVPPECSPSPRILRLSAGLTWEEAQEPLHLGINNQISGVGPGMPFSHSVLERDPFIRVIGLVPCATGGSSITQWARGGSLYNQLITRAQTALQGGRGRIRAILWYQGESDTSKREDAEQYEKRLTEFINSLRSDLGSPSIPFIQVELASGGYFMDDVRKAQQETCASLTNVICVDAKGLPLMGDNLHLTTTAQVQLGKMLADAFLRSIWLK